MKLGTKMLAFVVLMGLLSGLFCGCGGNGKVSGSSLDDSARQIKDIKDSGYIKVGVFKDNKPFGYLDLNGEYQGFDVYFARRIANDLGVKVQFVPVDADNREDALSDGEVDLVLANYSVTPERSKVVDFAMPYMKTSLGAVSSSKDTIKGMSDLEDKIVVVVQGTTADLYFTENDPEIKLIRVSQYGEAMEALEKGLGDVYCSDMLQIQAWVLEHGGFDAGVTIPGTEQQIAPAVIKDNTELLDWLNDEIAALQKEKFFTQGYEQILQPIYRDTMGKDEIIIE